MNIEYDQHAHSIEDFNIDDKVETLVGHRWNDYMRGDLGVVSEVNNITGMITVEFNYVTHDVHYSDLIKV